MPDVSYRVMMRQLHLCNPVPVYPPLLCCSGRLSTYTFTLAGQCNLPRTSFCKQGKLLLCQCDSFGEPLPLSRG